jgi:hypothetical protein
MKIKMLPSGLCRFVALSIFGTFHPTTNWPANAGTCPPEYSLSVVLLLLEIKFWSSIDLSLHQKSTHACYIIASD